MNLGSFSCLVVGTPVAERVVRLVITTTDIDSHGTIFAPLGCDLARYRRAPIVLWQHLDSRKTRTDPDDAIGRALRIDVEANRIVAEVEFEDGNPTAEKVLRKIRRGFLFSCSIGAAIIRSHMAGDITMVDEWELHEISIVLVGSNPSALVSRAARLFQTQRTNIVSQPELLSQLGLDATATYDQVCGALLEHLADTPEKKAMVQAAMAMKSPGDEGDDDKSPDGVTECKALRALNAHLTKELTALRAAAGPTPDGDPNGWARKQVERGFPASEETELAEQARVDPKTAKRFADLVIEQHKKTTDLLRRSLLTQPRDKQPGQTGPARSGPAELSLREQFAAKRQAAERTLRNGSR